MVALAALLVPLLIAYAPFALQVSAVQHFRRTGPGWSFPSKVFSDWIDLTPGRLLSPDYLRAELEARGYDPGGSERYASPGHYHDGGDAFTIGLREFDYPDGHAPAEVVRLRLHGGRLASVSRPTPAERPARLEPLMLAEWAQANREERTWVPLDSIPKVMRDAVVASEDRRFYQHMGFDLRGIGRALFRDVRGGGVQQGGSTLTQQVARNLFLSHRRTMERKLRETILALGLEMKLSKNDILELYLNTTYFGQRGGSGVAGVQEAARYYFDKPARALTLPEAAVLAGVIPAPNLYSPYSHPEAALRRRDLVLDAMAEGGFINRGQAARAKATPLRTSTGPPPPELFPYFTGYARDYLRTADRKLELETAGLRVFTTLDPVWQQAAEEELAAGIRDMGYPEDLQGAFCAADLNTGEVRAAVGGRDYDRSPFNRVYQSRRQPGSAFKAVVYSAAYDQNDGHSPYTPSTTVPDIQRDFGTPEGPWRPKNYEGEYHQAVSLSKALAKSLNVATANLVERISPQTVADYARRFGLGEVKPVMSLALGTSEVTLAQLVGVITTLGSSGRLTQLRPVRVVADPRGRTVFQPQPPHDQVVAPLTAHLMVEQLRNVVNFGTAYNLKGLYGFHGPAIGKTGTTDDENDAWFIGATPHYAAGVWLGYDQPESLHRSGSQAAVPVWARIMSRLMQGFPTDDFPTYPSEMEMATIDSYNGLLANPTCPSIIRTTFVIGTAPREVCPIQHVREFTPADTAAVDTSMQQPIQGNPDEGSGQPF